MAHFNLEKDLNSLRNYDSTLSKGPVARWERKMSEPSCTNNSLNVSNLNTSSFLNTTMNKSISGKTTPVKTPKLSARRLDPSMAGSHVKHRSVSAIEEKLASLEISKSVGEKRRLTPSRSKTPIIPSADSLAGGDRFIPNRSAMQLEISHYLLTKKSNEDEENVSPSSQHYREVMSKNLNGDLSDFRIIQYQNKAPLASLSHSNNLKVLYSSSKNPGSSKSATRYIPQTPDRVLDAPEIIDDYYLNVIDWSESNVLAVGLSGGVYLWNANCGDVKHLMEVRETGDYISSCSWVREGGSYLAIGTSCAEVELWDAEAEKRIRVMKCNNGRVASLSWNSHILSSGSKSGIIHHHDVRVADHVVGVMSTHVQEVCGLQWSPDGRYLASGGNDNAVNIWQLGSSTTQPLHMFNDHHSAVKAIAWCPWQPSLLASGGGTADRHIRFWNCNLGTCLNAFDTKSQVCAILWSKEYKELVSGHGFVNNELNIWKYPHMTKVTSLTGHTARILNLAMSPDGTTVISAGADETLRLWNCFAKDPKKKKSSSVSVEVKSHLMMKSIR